MGSTFQLIKKYSHVNWALADQAMVSGVNFLTGILFARYLGIEEFGRFTLVWMAVLFVNSIQMAMISSPMMSIGPKQAEEDSSMYYGAVTLHQLFFASFSSLILYIGVRVTSFISPMWHIEHLALPLATVGFFFQTQDFLRRYFFSRERQVAAFVNDAISYLGQIGVLVILFSVTSLDTASVLWVIAITSAIAVCMGMLILGDIDCRKIRFTEVLLRNWKFSKWITATTLLQWLSGNLFFIVVGNILGAAAVGILKASQNIIAVTHVLFLGLENIVPPKASLYFREHGVIAMITYLRKVVFVGGGATAIICFLVGLFPELWLGILYGADYLEYGFVLRWFAVIYLLMFFPFPLRAGLRTLDATRAIFNSYLLTAIFTVIFSQLMIRYFQLYGFLVGMLIVALSNSVCLLYYLIRTIRGHES